MSTLNLPDRAILLDGGMGRELRIFVGFSLVNVQEGNGYFSDT